LIAGAIKNYFSALDCCAIESSQLFFCTTKLCSAGAIESYFRTRSVWFCTAKLCRLKRSANLYHLDAFNIFNRGNS